MPVANKRVESTQLDFTQGSSASVDFRTANYGLVVRLVLTTSSDVYINFDADANDTNFVLQPGCPLEMNDIHFTTLSANGVSSAGTLYILAMRD